MMFDSIDLYFYNKEKQRVVGQLELYFRHLKKSISIFDLLSSHATQSYIIIELTIIK